MIWQDLHHSQLNTGQLYQILRLRAAVFVLEQQCLYQDMDGQDLYGDNRHILAWQASGLVACARVLAPAEPRQPVMIGRVIVASEARGCGLGVKLMQRAIASCNQYWPAAGQGLSAQAHLQPFYAELGFKACGEVYLEDNIPHIMMIKRPDNP